MVFKRYYERLSNFEDANGASLKKVLPGYLLALAFSGASGALAGYMSNPEPDSKSAEEASEGKFSNSLENKVEGFKNPLDPLKSPLNDSLNIGPYLSGSFYKFDK